MVSEQGIPAEAVEAAEKALWVKMIVDGPPSIGLDVSAALAAALPHLRERWLAEVEGALQDMPRYLAWLRAKGIWDADSADAADYLRDVLGAGAAGEGGDGS